MGLPSAATSRALVLRALLCALVLCCVLNGYCHGTEKERITTQQRREKAWLINLVAIGGVTTWGVINWDYFSQSPRSSREHWLGHNTTEGGADKFGHLWASYTLSHSFASLYQHIGYSAPESNRYGSLSALAVTGLMEVGDSFSANYGFSAEDMLANISGAAVGWLLLEHQDWRKKIDLRWEYCPDFDHLEGDIVTDYEHAKYLVAIKAAGFEQIEQPWLKALELHLGYYSRHYDSYRPNLADRRQRYLYAGLGLNVGYLLQPVWKTRLFNYLQLPHTYQEWHHRH